VLIRGHSGTSGGGRTVIYKSGPKREVSIMAGMKHHSIFTGYNKYYVKTTSLKYERMRKRNTILSYMHMFGFIATCATVAVGSVMLIIS
jgi:hypothetical protein